jgi:hypothetical protein
LLTGFDLNSFPLSAWKQRTNPFLRRVLFRGKREGKERGKKENKKRV